MPLRKASRKKPRKRPKTPGRRKGKMAGGRQMPMSISYEPAPLSSYESALVRDILSSKKSGKATEFSLLFNSILSTITPSMRNLYYENGVSVGRLLHSIYHSRRRYILYEEGIADLASFFEKIGYSRITYHIFPDRVDMKFNSRSRASLGENVHVFESGIISGFLSTSRRRRVHAMEVQCSCNGYGHCSFIASDSAAAGSGGSGHELLGRFADSVKENVAYRHSPVENRFSEEYLMLSAITLLEREYSEHMNKIAYHLGSEIGSRLNLKLNSRSAKSIERLYALLGLGSLSVKSYNPLRIEVLFNTLKAKKEFVDISIAFLDGLLKDMVAGNHALNASTSNRKGSYVVRVRESKI